MDSIKEVRDLQVFAIVRFLEYLVIEKNLLNLTEKQATELAYEYVDQSMKKVDFEKLSQVLLNYGVNLKPRN